MREYALISSVIETSIQSWLGWFLKMFANQGWWLDDQNLFPTFRQRSTDLSLAWNEQIFFQTISLHSIIFTECKTRVWSRFILPIASKEKITEKRFNHKMEWKFNEEWGWKGCQNTFSQLFSKPLEKCQRERKKERKKESEEAKKWSDGHSHGSWQVRK